MAQSPISPFLVQIGALKNVGRKVNQFARSYFCSFTHYDARLGALQPL